MKQIASIITVLFMSVFQLYAQEDSEKFLSNLLLSTNVGVQAHDKRLFDFPAKQRVLDNQKGWFGTYQLNVNLHKFLNLSKNPKISVGVGLGLGMEINTFKRPFDHNYNQEIGTDILKYIEKYRNYLFDIPLNVNYQINDKFTITMEILNQFNYLSSINTKGSSNNKYTWWKFNFHSIEFNPGIKYEKDKFYLGFHYRVFQIKRIDRIIFNRILVNPDESKDSPRPGQKLEIHNPFKIWFTVGYKL